MTKKAAAAHTCWFLLVLGAYFAGTSTRPPSVDTAGTPARDIAVAIWGVQKSLKTVILAPLYLG